jgi:hypothetical protein
MPSQLQYGGAGAAQGFANAFLGGMNSMERMAYANALRQNMYDQRGSLAMQLAAMRQQGMNDRQQNSFDFKSDPDNNVKPAPFIRPDKFDLTAETGKAFHQAMLDQNMTEKKMQMLSPDDISTQGAIEDAANKHLQDTINVYNSRPQNQGAQVNFAPTRHFYVKTDPSWGPGGLFGGNKRVAFDVNGYPPDVSRDQAATFLSSGANPALKIPPTSAPAPAPAAAPVSAPPPAAVMPPPPDISQDAGSADQGSVGSAPPPASIPAPVKWRLHAVR